MPFLAGNSEWRVGAFVNLEFRPQQDLILSGGLRGDINSMNQNILNPRLSAILKLDKHQTLRLSFIQAFRKPSSREFGVPTNLKQTTGPGADFMDALVQGNFLGEDIATFADVLATASDSNGNVNLKSEKVYSIELAYQLELLNSSR